MTTRWCVGVFAPLDDGMATLVDSRRFTGPDGRHEAYWAYVRLVDAVSGYDARRIGALPHGEAPYMGRGSLVRTEAGPRVVVYHAEVPRA